MICVALFPLVLNAQDTPAGVGPTSRYADAVHFAMTLVTAAREEGGTPGMSVAVGVDGRLVWAEGFGFSDLEQRTPVWEDTMFRIGSVSKPLTAAAIGLLAEHGRLDLDVPIQQYVPNFPKKPWPITTRQLGGHLAGIRHYSGDEEIYSSKQYATVLDGLQIFQNDTLLFPPGSAYSYTTYGWSLISAVLEGASGREFLLLMEEDVFDPLGMDHTVADRPARIVSRRSRFYHRSDDGEVVNAPYVDNSYKWAGGGFLSTPSDLIRFAFAHLQGDLLEVETVEMLWTPQATNDGESTGYGIGWKVRTEGPEVIQAAHDGSSIGGTAILILRPQENAAIAIMGNMTGAPTGGELPVAVLEAFLHPESLVSTEVGPDVTGSFECSLTTMAGREITTGSLQIGGSPSEYWGTLRLGGNDGVLSRIVYSQSTPAKTDVVVVFPLGHLMSLRFSSVEPKSLDGTWSQGGGGRVTCHR